MRTWSLVLCLLAAAVCLPACGSGASEPAPGGGGAKKKKKAAEPAPPAKEKREVPKALLEALVSADREKRDASIRELAGYGASAVAPLSALLSSEDLEARTAALAALHGVGHASAREAVEKHLEGASTIEDRLYAAMALGRCGEASSVPVLKALLAYEAEPRFGPEAAWMVDKGRETDTGLVRNQAAESLARLGDVSGVPVLIENLLSNGWVRKDALIRLRKMTGCKVDFGYNLGAGNPEREAAVALWKAWWSKNADGFVPEWTESPKIYDLNKRG